MGILNEIRVQDSLRLARAIVNDQLKNYKNIDVYNALLEEVIEDLDKILFEIERERLLRLSIGEEKK